MRVVHAELGDRDVLSARTSLDRRKLVLRALERGEIRPALRLLTRSHLCLRLITDQLDVLIAKQEKSGQLSTTLAARVERALTASTADIRAGRPVPTGQPGGLDTLLNNASEKFLRQADAFDPATLAAALPSGIGIDSPRPFTARAPGTSAVSTDRMRSSGSMATTRATLPRSSLVIAPVPAPRSTTTVAESGIIQEIAASGGPGRTRS